MRYELKHLSAFVAVAEELNFHRAAERLSMAQPAVSRIVLELEQRIGVKLLERTTRQVRLTESGRYFLKEAQGVLSRIETAERNVQMLASGAGGILRVGYTTITGHSLVPDITREFKKKNPDVRLELTYMTAPQQRDKILQSQIEFGFIEGSFQSAEIATRIVARHRLVVLMMPGHPLATKDLLTIEDIVKEPLVIGTPEEWPTFRRILSEAFQSAGQVLSIAQEASSLTGLLGLVTAGVGVTVFCGRPRFCGDSAIVAKPLHTDPAVIVETRLAWRRTKANSAMMRFIETSQRVGEAYLRGESAPGARASDGVV